MDQKIKIVEVGLRDGLQNETVTLSPSIRLSLADRLVDAGVECMELGSFVSPKWVPQMAGSGELFKKVHQKQKMAEIPESIIFSALVPNLRGMNEAIANGVKEVAIFASSTESFSQKNVNCSIDESYRRLETVVALAKENEIKVRAYLSTCFGCPYEGEVKVEQVLKGVKRMLELGVAEISIGDTIGVANPKQVKRWIAGLSRETSLTKIAMHFHDTRGLALANVLQSVEMGVRTFDSSIGGLGGCPYAEGATGNVATEDVVRLLHSMGFKTALDLDKLIKISHWLGEKMGRELPARVSQINS